MPRRLSKSEFKPRALEIFREVQSSGEEVIITDKGRPVLRIVPIVEDIDALLAPLHGSVLRYDDPTEPVDVEWEASR